MSSFLADMLAVAFGYGLIKHSEKKQEKKEAERQALRGFDDKAKEFYAKVMDDPLEFSIKREDVREHPEYYEWTKEFYMRFFGLSQEEADERFPVGKMLYPSTRPLSYVDAVMLHHGKLSSHLGYGLFELIDSRDNRFTKESWDETVRFAKNVDMVLRKYGVYERLLLWFIPERNLDDFSSQRLPSMYYLDEMDYEFVFDLYIRYGREGRRFAKIMWAPLAATPPSHKWEKINDKK